MNAFLFVFQTVGEGWEPVGHAVPLQWLPELGRVGSWLLATLVLGLVVRAFLRRHLYRALDVLTDGNLEALHNEIARVERRTVGEVLPVIVERSDRHPATAWISALTFLVLGSAVLGTWLPWDVPVLLVTLQLLFGGIGYYVAHALPDFARLFVRESRATEMAEEQAFQEFYRHGLHETECRTGVLLFVSLFERRVVVLADEGIDAVVDQDQWEKTDAAILEGVSRGSLRDGLLTGIKSAGDVLAEHFPWQDGDRNEIPDRIIVRKE